MLEQDLNCTVVSLVPFPINEEKPGLIPPRFRIEASDCVEPRVLVIGTCFHYVYLDETRGSLQVRNPSNEVAESIVQDYINSQLMIDEDTRPAIFWIPGSRNVAEVNVLCGTRIKESLVAQRRWFNAICKLADDDWSRYHKHAVVSDFQRTAARLLGWNPDEHEWMTQKDTFASPKCPACGNSVEGHTVVCSSCKCIIDPEKYKTLQFA